MTNRTSFDDIHVDDLLRRLVPYGGTELCLIAGQPPFVTDQSARYPLLAENLLSDQAKRLCYAVTAPHYPHCGKSRTYSGC